MSEIELYLLEYDKHRTEALQQAREAATRLENKSLKLVTLVEQLGEYLVNEDESIRAKTLFFLTDVLNALPAKTLSRQQRNLLCDFVLSRIATDPDGIEAAARSLIALESMGKWENERAAQIFISLLDGTNPLKLFKLQKQRYAILQLIDLLMAKYRNALEENQASRPDTLEKLVFYFDGEKDPRNLMIVFSVLLVPMTEWDVSANAQEFFEGVFNYFPITFKPPPDDPYGITAQQLKDRLRDCISATSYLAPFSFPALLDKLDSTSPNTKRDSLQAIKACVTNYTPRTVSLYAVTLWDALKFEILNVQEEQLAEQALAILASIATRLSESGDLQSYLKPIAKECNEHLEDAPTKQSQAAGRILHTISGASAEASNFLSKAVLPQIISLHETAGSVSKRHALAAITIELVRANVLVFGEWRTIDRELFQRIGSRENALSDFNGQLQGILLGGLSDTPKQDASYRTICINGLANLVKVRSLLKDEQISKILQTLTRVILNEASYDNEEVRTAAESSLLEIAYQKPQIVVSEAFPPFLAALPDSANSEDSTYLHALATFAKLSYEPQIFETVVTRLRNKLAVALQNTAPSNYVLALLNAILYAFTRGAFKDSDSTIRAKYHDFIVVWLLDRLQDSIEGDNIIIAGLSNGPSILTAIGRICRSIIVYEDVATQEQLAGRLLKLVAGRFEKFAESPDVLKEQQILVVATHILAAIKPDVTLPFQTSQYLYWLVTIAKEGTLPSEVVAASLSQITLLVNKFIPESELNSSIDIKQLSLNQTADPSTLNLIDIRLTFAITKALVLRNSKLASSHVSSLLNHLPDPTNGPTIARGFSSILAPSEFLTTENHCRISKLHAQKLFNLTIPIIASSWRTAASPAAKQNYLIALSGILQHLPYSILEPELTSLVPLLLQSVDPSSTLDANLKAGAINTLTSIVNNNPDAVAEHANSLAARLLAAAKSGPGKEGGDGGNDARVRLVALECLTAVPGKLRRETILPFRMQVVKQLTGALDDGKRAVRKEAVRCRVRWMGLDEDDDD